MSMLRTAWRSRDDAQIQSNLKELGYGVALAQLFFVFWFWPLAWCVMFLLLVVSVLAQQRRVAVRVALALAPLAYLGLLVALNYMAIAAVHTVQ